MAKSKKMSMTNIIWTAVLAVALILVIVGICVDYVSVTGSSIFGGGTLSNVGLFDMTGSNQPDAAATWGTLSVVTAIITIVLCVAGIAIALLKMFGSVKISSLVSLIVGVITAVVAVLAIVCVFVYGSQYSASLGELSSLTASPAKGAWLVSIGGVVSGVACILNK